MTTKPGQPDPDNPYVTPESYRATYLDGWKLYPFKVIIHHGVGVLAAALMLFLGNKGIALGAAIIYLYVSYQIQSRIRKQDASGIDIYDLLLSFIVTIIGVVGYTLFFL